MVGVPRSKRCQRCKRIKVKCDENWPNCTPCVRANVPCSGPPTLTKFVHHKSTDETLVGDKTEGRFSAAEMPVGNLESLRHRNLPGGASFGHFRLASDEPRKNLTTVADRVGARLVRFVDHEDAPWDMLTYAGYMKYIPGRLSESAALRDAVALMCSTWANARRNVPTNQLIDPSLYGKALRNLQRALDDQKQQITAETLAAVTILERLDGVFDTKYPYNVSTHGVGVAGLMAVRGPPNIEDELDIHLATENHAALISHLAFNGGDNFYLRSPWKEVMTQARVRLKKIVSNERLDGYAIGRYFGYWPGLIHSLLNISEDPDINTRQAQAEALQRLVTNFDTQVQNTCEPITQRAFNAGRINELPDPESPIGTKLHFKSLDIMSFFLSYVWMRIMLNRMLDHLAGLLGESNDLLEAENRELSKQIWMCIPFLRSLGKVPYVFSRTPIIISYEGGNEVEREYILDNLMGMPVYSTRAFPADKKTLEAHVLSLAKAMSGRQRITVTPR
ncbi:uncharacterized protein F4822DRAFT_279231 [Hypoxylon trugodes]|uniref:uncharacterized protein n=1 Tax=Hypoxylon trugodes TaxID=326681 RepID=UPI00218EA1DE|nr:uncharacterized protein F4822DRAFT_279231 [Hypoxylon trugodes]KAI1387319.1 hypothetical protein F4822DRAFT_279231 [Hypoxylon trugodes]